MQTMCPCETAKFFRSRQDIQMTINPFNMSRNCYIPLAVPVSSEGAYFFKKKKKEKQGQLSQRVAYYSVLTPLSIKSIFISNFQYQNENKSK